MISRHGRALDRDRRRPQRRHPRQRFIQFLRSLPGQGRISFRVYDWQGPPHDATFQFSGLEDVRRKIAEACKWPEGEARRR